MPFAPGEPLSFCCSLRAAESALLAFCLAPDLGSPQARGQHSWLPEFLDFDVAKFDFSISFFAVCILLFVPLVLMDSGENQ